MIGLQKAIEVSNFNVNQVADKIGVRPQTVSNWVKQKARIPSQRLQQLSQIAEFSFIDQDLFQKEIDEVQELEIEIAYTCYLSERESVEAKGGDGTLILLDPHAQTRAFLQEMKAKTLLLKEAKDFLQNDEYVEDFDGEVGETYMKLFQNFNRLFYEKNYKQVKMVMATLGQPKISWLGLSKETKMQSVKQVWRYFKAVIVAPLKKI